MGHPEWGTGSDQNAALEGRLPWPSEAPPLVSRFIREVQRTAERRHLLAILTGQSSCDTGVRQFTTRPNFAGGARLLVLRGLAGSTETAGSTVARAAEVVEEGERIEEPKTWTSIHVDLDLRAAAALLLMCALFIWRWSFSAKPPEQRGGRAPYILGARSAREDLRAESSGPRRGFLQALTGLNASLALRRAASAESDYGTDMPKQDPKKCIYCQGEGILVCWRCGGSKKMTEIEDPTRFRDCSECEDWERGDATGYKPCGTCQTTGLSPELLKTYSRDEKFRKVMARLRKTKCDEDGRAKIKRAMTNALAEVEAKFAAAEGRDAVILRAPEAAKIPEPSGTWIGS
eukprot:g2539.t1